MFSIVSMRQKDNTYSHRSEYQTEQEGIVEVVMKASDPAHSAVFRLVV